MFSGSAENATPRYNYNQIMYRLDLDDPRLALPVAVYQIAGNQVIRKSGNQKIRDAGPDNLLSCSPDTLLSCSPDILLSGYPDTQDLDYLLRDGVEKAGKWNSIESIPFYAIEPARACEELIPVYVYEISGENGRTLSLTVERPDSSARPLFFALPLSAPENENSCIVSLYEYCHADTGQRLYSVKARLQNDGWTRTEDSLCRVWQAPSEFVVHGQ